MPLRMPRRAAMLLKTGQTTSYSSENDDGHFQTGIAKSYTVLSTGAYSGTVNLDLAHYTGGAGAIAFDNVAKTITDTGNGLAMFKTNDVIMTDAPNNPGPFTVTTGNVAGTITCAAATFVTETPAGAITLSKREAKSNNAVLDNNTGLMWSRYVSASMGTASDGKMPWTGQLYDIFAYAAAANAASLAGYTDWRVANIPELLSLLVGEAPAGIVDTTAFPGWPNSGGMFSSTTEPDITANALYVGFNNYTVGLVAKTTAVVTALVRGGA